MALRRPEGGSFWTDAVFQPQRIEQALQRFDRQVLHFATVSRLAYPMNQHAFRSVSFAAMLVWLSACTTTTGGAAAPAVVPGVGQQASIEGEVVSVDLAPWTYDGNAVVTVSSEESGTLQVQLPARWNLCKAAPPEDVQTLKAGDRVQAIGTVSAPGELVVCEQAQHRLRRLP